MRLVRGNIFQEHSARRGVVPTELNIARYNNTVSAIAWVQLGIFVFYLTIILDSFSQIQVFMTSIYLNSSLKPFLYCWKIREAKQAVKDTIRQQTAIVSHTKPRCCTKKRKTLWDGQLNSWLFSVQVLYSGHWNATRKNLSIKVAVVIPLVYEEWLIVGRQHPPNWSFWC